MNDIRWNEHPLYADVVKRVPPELHPTLARAVDLRAADAWLHEGCQRSFKIPPPAVIENSPHPWLKTSMK